VCQGELKYVRGGSVRRGPCVTLYLKYTMNVYTGSPTLPHIRCMVVTYSVVAMGIVDRLVVVSSCYMAVWHYVVL